MKSCCFLFQIKIIYSRSAICSALDLGRSAVPGMEPISQRIFAFWQTEPSLTQLTQNPVQNTAIMLLKLPNDQLQNLIIDSVESHPDRIVLTIFILRNQYCFHYLVCLFVAAQKPYFPPYDFDVLWLVRKVIKIQRELYGIVVIAEWAPQLGPIMTFIFKKTLK